MLTNDELWAETQRQLKDREQPATKRDFYELERVIQEYRAEVDRRLALYEDEVQELLAALKSCADILTIHRKTLNSEERRQLTRARNAIAKAQELRRP